MTKDQMQTFKGSYSKDTIKGVEVWFHTISLPAPHHQWPVLVSSDKICYNYWSNYCNNALHVNMPSNCTMKPSQLTRSNQNYLGLYVVSPEVKFHKWCDQWRGQIGWRRATRDRICRGQYAGSGRQKLQGLRLQPSWQSTLWNVGNASNAKPSIWEIEYWAMIAYFQWWWFIVSSKCKLS